VCGTTHRTVRRIVGQYETGDRPVPRVGRARNYDSVRALVAKRVAATRGRISAKRLLPEARADGYAGSARNFRRLVAEAKAKWHAGEHRGRRPAVWTPGETLVIDWGVEHGLHVFCAVAAWSRWRFVRFAVDERAETTLGLLAECFEALGGVPRVVLSDRRVLDGDEIVAEHALVAPGEVSVCDEHYGAARPATPARSPRARTEAEKTFLALGPVAEAFLKGAAAAGTTRLGAELEELAGLHAGHGRDAVLAALGRAVAFRRWRATDVRSILAAGTAVPQPTTPGEALVIELPVVPTRPLSAYGLEELG